MIHARIGTRAGEAGGLSRGSKLHVRAGLAVLLAAGLAQPAGAVVHAKAAEAPMVTTGRPPRAYRDVTWAPADALDRAGFRGWTTIYDRDTDVPLRIWGPGLVAPGAMASPAIAEAWAKKFLAEHLDVLAPGAAPADFVLVANQLNPSGDVRSVGFAQQASRIAVLGGTISFAFKNDRMIMAGSTALPHVALAPAALLGQRLAAARVTSAAAAWLGAAGHSVAARGPVAAAQVIVPIVHPRGAGGTGGTGGVDITYTLAEQVTVEATAGEPGRWNVYVDAGTGAAFARESTLMFGSGTVLFDVSDRGPLATAGRHPQPAGKVTHQVNGAAVLAGADGVVTWTGTAPATVLPGLTGPLVAVTSHAGALVTDSLTLADGGSVTWSRATEEANDAQLASFVFANQAKQYVKARLNPTLAYLDQLLSVTVNDGPGMCNAYSTGDDLHFFPQTPGRCENTGRISDVVYHEFGHSMHRHSLIPGVGQFNGAMSEGVADTLGVAMTGDSGLGRGFFLDNRALRELNPPTKKIWPRDVDGEVHDDGEIYGETMWDLRSKLQARLGTAAGFDRFLKIYYGTVQRAVDIPSCFAEALVADDDDGDLTNGTPNGCDILSAFAAHGLYDPIVTGALSPPVRDRFTISVATATPAVGACSLPTVQTASLAWRLRGGPFQLVPLAASGPTLSATIPTQPDGSIVEYSVTVTLSNGGVELFPNNKVDPYYQFYVGDVTKLWCADFEAGAADWTHTASPAARDPWQAGAPMGLGGDPKVAFAGTQVFGTALTQLGTYPASTIMSAVSPVIDLQGHANVHLQYERWLGVEDGFYDQATITANDLQVWKNFTSSVDPGPKEANHIDQEWRFQDIDVSAAAAKGTMTLTFGLTSDEGFEAAGWNLDNLCLVAPPPACGNQIVEAGELCDDGNTADGDGCSATCQDEDAGGCCGIGGHPAAPAGLSVLVLGWVLRRRRRA
jgi:cysteine-rich repeat protein